MVEIDKAAYFKQIGYIPHPKQVLYHNSNARFKIAVCGRRFGKSKMAATDIEPELLLPNKRFWIVGPCVDEETEILSQRGWLTYRQLQVGDQVLTLNQQGLAEWQPCLDVKTYTGLHAMTRIQQRGHDSFTTPHHRWLVGYTGSDPSNPKTRRDLGFRFTTTAEMTKPNEYVLGGAPVLNLPQEPKYQDSLVELVGWYWTEGTDQASGNGVLITQNSGENADRIRVAAQTLFGPASSSSQMRNSYDLTPRWSDWKPITNQPTCGRFGFNSQAGAILRQVAPDKVVSFEFVSSLTLSQLALLVDTSVRADGHSRIRTKSSGASCVEKVVVQDRRDRLSPIQMAAQLLGYQTTLLYDKSGERWCLSIFERSRMWLGQKTAVAKRQDVNDYDGTVWCPKTPNGTWLARRNGTVYFTANTYDLGEKEFRVIWDDLIIKLRLGEQKGTKKSFNLRTGDMYIEFPWQTRIEVKTAHINPEKNLVGEGLDGVIISEAAKHNPEIWNRFIRPALSDKRGWATFVTTPEGYNWLYDIWRLGKDSAFPEYESWRFPSWENKIIYPGGRDDDEIKLLERTLSGDEFDQEIGALFTASSGRIYGEFDEDIHVSDFEYNPAWPSYMGIDWGFSHPLAAIEFQVSPSEEVYVWREYYRQYQVLEACFEEMRQREQPKGYHLDYIFGDAEDPEATLRTNQKFGPCLSLPEAKKNWRQGVDLVKKFLKPQQVGFDEYERPIKRPHLYISSHCPTLAREFTNYKKKASNTDIRETTSTGSVQKKDDHGLDALRYGMMHVFELGAQDHLSDVIDVNPLLVGVTDNDSDFGFFTLDNMRF